VEMVAAAAGAAPATPTKQAAAASASSSATPQHASTRTADSKRAKQKAAPRATVRDERHDYDYERSLTAQEEKEWETTWQEVMRESFEADLEWQAKFGDRIVTGPRRDAGCAFGCGCCSGDDDDEEVEEEAVGAAVAAAGGKYENLLKSLRAAQLRKDPARRDAQVLVQRNGKEQGVSRARPGRGVPQVPQLAERRGHDPLGGGAGWVRRVPDVRGRVEAPRAYPAACLR